MDFCKECSIRGNACGTCTVPEREDLARDFLDDNDIEEMFEYEELHREYGGIYERS